MRLRAGQREGHDRFVTLQLRSSRRKPNARRTWLTRAKLHEPGVHNARRHLNQLRGRVLSDIAGDDSSIQAAIATFQMADPFSSTRIGASGSTLP